MQVNHQPYVGPRPFRISDQANFFGRDREAHDLADLIVANGAVLLHSKSGLGKTSLVNAQLIPLLMQEGFEVLPVTRVARQTLETADLRIRNIYVFNALIGCSRQHDDPTRLADVTFTEYLARLERSEDVFGDPSPLILIFDQFEELFTTYPDRWRDRRDFFEQIGEALEENRSLRVIFSMREEYIGEMEPYVSLLSDRPPRRFRLEGLNQQAAIVCVREPLNRTDKTFAPGVAEKLVKDLLRVHMRTSTGMSEIEGQFVEPVQLQIVCQNLWNSLDPTISVITESHLEKLGNVDQSLDSFYEEVIRTTVQKTRIKEGQLRRWFESALITPAGSRGVVFRGGEESGKLPNRVIDELESQHIIKAELRGGERWYELSHDRFIDVIKNSNRRWLSKLPRAEAAVSQLEERASAWRREGRDRKSLLSPRELARAELSLSQTGGTTSDSLLAFLEASALEKAQRQRSFQLLTFTVLLILLLIILVFVLIKYRQIKTMSGVETAQSPVASSGHS